MKIIFSTYLILFLIFGIISCNQNSFDKNGEAKFVMENVHLDTIVFDNETHPNMCKVYGILSIEPIDTSEYIDLSDYTIRDSIFENVFDKLPLLEETRLIATSFIDFNRRIVDNSAEPRNWVKLSNEKNLYYFFGLANLQYPNKEILYFKMLFMIKGKEVEKLYKYSIKDKKISE